MEGENAGKFPTTIDVWKALGSQEIISLRIQLFSNMAHCYLYSGDPKTGSMVIKAPDQPYHTIFGGRHEAESIALATLVSRQFSIGTLASVNLGEDLNLAPGVVKDLVDEAFRNYR